MLELAVLRRPGDPNAWYELGCLQGRLHDFTGAEQSLRRAIQLDPGLAKAHYQLGLTVVGDPKSKLDWLGAIEEFRTALRLQPAYPEALQYLGVGLTATGDNAEAVGTLRQAVQLAPKLASAHFNLALALESVGRNTEAVAEYRSAVALRPKFPEGSSALGKLLFRMGDLRAAEQELRTALRQNPDLQDAHYGLSQVLRAGGAIGEARQEAEIALALGRREPDGIASSNMSNAALQEAANGDLAKADEMLRQAILLRPDYGVPHYNLGLILADRQAYEASISELSQAASLLLGKAKPWFDLARVLRMQGREAEAHACMVWAAALSPDDPRITAALAASTPPAKAGSDEKAPEATLVQPAFGALSDSAEGYLRYAETLGAKGDIAGQIGELLTSLSYSPDSVETRLRLAAAYERMVSTEKASQEYRKVLLISPGNATAEAALTRTNRLSGRR